MKYKFTNCFVNISNEKEYLEAIINALDSKSINIFYYLNSFSFYLADKNSQFSKAFNGADYIIADGYSIVWMIKQLFNKQIEKVVFTYSFFKEIANLFSAKNKKIFLLGAKQHIIEQSAIIMESKYNLKIVGFTNGYFSNGETEKLICKINDCNPDVIIVGMGMPKAETWIMDNKGKLNARVVFSVGGFFDFITRDRKIAPSWMYNSGLEWIYRILQEPGRLFVRYLKANTYLVYQTIKKKYF